MTSSKIIIKMYLMKKNLETLIEENSFKKDVITKIKKQRNWAIAAWIILLIILLVVVEMISVDSTTEWIVNLFVKLREK